MSWINPNLEQQAVKAKNSRKSQEHSQNPAEDIAHHFNKFLAPQLAVNSALKQEVFKIRYNVYCEELTFEPPNQQGIETDEFDSRSIFSLVKHRPSGLFTSCIRLITTQSKEELLPIEKFCFNSITHQALHPNNFHRNSISEVSRLAVKKNYRRRKSDAFKGCAEGGINQPTYSAEELRSFPFIAISLYMSAAIIGRANGIEHLYVMMEPRLARNIKLLGVNFTQLGEPVDYHGLRAPYHITPEEFISSLAPSFKVLFDVIESDLLSQLELTGNLITI